MLATAKNDPGHGYGASHGCGYAEGDGYGHGYGSGSANNVGQGHGVALTRKHLPAYRDFYV